MSDTTKQIAPLRLVLEGQFWDSHIYMGKLYLFTLDGRVHTVEWDRLVSEFALPTELALPMQYAFSRSDYLYDNQRDLTFQDPQVREVIQTKFVRLAKHHEVPRAADWRYYLLNTRDTPFPFPHIDATIYMKGFFSVCETGVFVSSISELESKSKSNSNSKSKSKRGKKGKVLKLWDCPVISVDASYGALALAAGPEGLFEFELDDWVSGDPRQAKPINKRDCTDCSWAYYSIVGSSHKQGSIFAEYAAVTDHHDNRNGSKTKIKNGKDFEPTNLGRSWREAPKVQRQFEKTFAVEEIFDQKGYCWGGMDKICQASDGVMTVAQYSPWEDDAAKRFRVLRRITFDSGKGTPVCGAVAPFGSIIELDRRIVVVRSDDEIFMIPGLPVNWRVFNRSKQYENQLHVIYENRLEIYSFNHDYFVDQKEKCSGSLKR
ncbi:MAG TPA: hypothetical protein VMF08_04270 [Candidatus Sulfotelmatobacter sp.]|nr:hypothetical protein [Candidatus Sulfotelmatobacter sp.]